VAAAYLIGITILQVIKESEAISHLGRLPSAGQGFAKLIL
jgi:hypothetical protein